MSRKAGTPNKPKENHQGGYLKNQYPPIGFKDETTIMIENKQVANTPFVHGVIEEKITNDFQPKYILTQSEKADVLILHVNGFIEIGYECQGGVSVTSWRDVNGIEYLYSQAMVRKEM